MTIAATDLETKLVLTETGQDVAPRPRRDNVEAVGLVVGILVALAVLAATVGSASPADATSAVDTQSSATSQGGAPMLDWYRISDSNR